MTVPQSTEARKRHRTRYPGVYYRIDRAGRRAYLIGFRDEQGRQVWKRVPGDLEDAKDALGEVRRKAGAGEPVRPSSKTFAEVEAEWSAIYLPKLRPSTAATYRASLRRYVLPEFGHLPIARVDERALAAWVTELQGRGLKAWTIRAALTPLRRILTYAVRQRLIAENPVTRLGRDELPASDQRERRVLDAGELGGLLDAATPRSRLALEVLAFTGLRASELLGLVWSDIDTSGGTLRVSRQLDGAGERVRPKTPQAVRTVYLAPFVSKGLAARRLGSPCSGPDDFVFGADAGGPWSYPGLVAGFKTALKRVQLDGEPAPTLHSLRHGFGSMLIAQGSDVVFTSRQLGHASPAITMRIYAHEFGTAESAAKMTAGLEQAFGDRVANG